MPNQSILDSAAVLEVTAAVEDRFGLPINAMVTLADYLDSERENGL